MSGTDPDRDSGRSVGGEPAPGEGARDPDGRTAASDEGEGDTDPTALYERLRSSGERVFRSYPALIVVAVVVGVVLAPVVAAVAVQGSSGTVAVVPLEGTIDGGSATALAATLERAREDPEIDAVVLQINSGGGAVAASETMYLEISKTADEMPVVASVDAIAASGAYYAAVGSDRIYVKPASLAGNVGVTFVPPPDQEPNDAIVTTGPNKLTGATERGWRYKTQALEDAFASAVVEGRGDALELPPEEVATGELFTGSEAVETGMADEIGARRDAIEHAAAGADLRSYDVRVMRPQSNATFLTRTAYLASDASNRTMVSARYFVGGETGSRYPNFLMIPPGTVTEELAGEVRNGTDRPSETPGALASEVDRGR